MDNGLLSVKQVAEQLQKHEETIKRWLRSGKFQNAYKESDKAGWQIPQEDLQGLLLPNNNPRPIEKQPTQNASILPMQNENAKVLVSLVYQAVTMTSPTENIIEILNLVGIKRTLEILLILQQSPNKVKNPEGFIKKAISKGWNPTTLPIKKERNFARVQQHTDTHDTPTVPFYNWLDE